MVSDARIKELKKRLETRRQELRDEREELETKRTRLSEPEVELEEQAGKQQMMLKLEQQDRRTRDELKLVNDALVRMEADPNAYGLCLECGKDISEERLETMPWTTTCKDCSSGQGPEAGEALQPETASLPPDFRGLDDESIAASVRDKLAADGRVELQDLNIEAEDGLLRLGGTLPSNENHQVLMQMVQDVMGFIAVEDNVRVDRTAWQREDRAQGLRGGENPTEEQTLLEGEPVEEDPYASRREGEQITPPDEIVPEKEKK
jgi:RNA polymerase-binding transcription factor DksA